MDRPPSPLALASRAGVIWSGLLVATAAAFAVTWASWRSGKQSVSAYLLFGYAAAMLLNVFVPHLPATLLFHAYTPGVATALALNLPVMSLLLWRALHEDWVSGWRAMAYAVLVPLGICGSIVVLLTLTPSS